MGDTDYTLTETADMFLEEVKAEKADQTCLRQIRGKQLHGCS